MSPTSDESLEARAKTLGISPSYKDAFGKSQKVSPDTLRTLLAVVDDAGSGLTEPSHGRSVIPPVVIAWDGKLELQTKATTAELELDRHGDGAGAQPGQVETGVRIDRNSGTVVSRGALPFGIHILHLSPAVAGDGLSDTAAGATDARPHRLGQKRVMVISAPRRARPLPRSWGLFAPTYALRDERESATGDLSDLRQLCRIAGGLGASYVSTLPLLADFSKADDPAAVASPYSPISRMWWNEGYVDPRQVPELAGVGPAGVPPGGGARGVRNAKQEADVAAAAAALRPMLDEGLSRLRHGGGHRLADFERFVKGNEGLELYAAFRAAAEQHRTEPWNWPEDCTASRIRARGGVPEAAVGAHMYAQWLCHEQLATLASEARQSGCGLMLDLPIGCSPQGFDPWAYPRSFAGGEQACPGGVVHVGAPPDRFFHAGQDWGFRPLSPEAERRAGYPVVRSCLSQLMSHCDALRIDHVMGLQRLWWIPPGASPDEGAYVYYHFEEMLALTCLEAWRHDVSVAGEDLGTVDPAVRRQLQDHGISGMHVGVFDLAARPGKPLSPRAGSMAFVDTHDTATFAGWFAGSDIAEHVRLGYLDDTQAEAEHVARRRARRACIKHYLAAGLLDPGSEDDPVAVHNAVLEELGRSEAGLISVNIEDLWGEPDPQNIPGTGNERPNFSRRLPRTLAEIEASDDVVMPLRRLDAARRHEGELATSPSQAASTTQTTAPVRQEKAQGSAK